MLKIKKLNFKKKMSDPKVKKNETEFMRQKRNDSNIKQKQSKSRKTKEHNTIICQIEIEKNKKEMQKKPTKSNMYRDKKIIKKWTKHYNSLCKDKYSNLYTEDVHQSWTPIFTVDRQFQVTNVKTNKNTLQNEITHENPCNILNEKQKFEIRKYGTDMKGLLDIFNRKTSEGPIYVCTCCHQLWFRHCLQC